MVVQFRALEPRRWNVIHPESFYPGMSDVSRVCRPGHARHNSLPSVFPVGVEACGAAVSRSKKLPLLEREVRQFVDANKEEFRALILVNVVLVAAITEPRR